ncbi:MAG: hypothetical protein GX348_05745 [Veillonellaceae bacterium]|nr:hypothetical protein [Veillonellaceae bacterium]
MANLKVLQDQPEKLKSQLYGFDGTNVVPLLADETGRTNIRLLTNADTVTAVANDLDIRDLANTTDSVSVYGNDGTQNRIIKTTETGQLDIRPLTSSDNVTVTATDLDIRDLANTTDSVAVYGNDGTQNHIIKTTDTGQLDIRPLTSDDTITAVMSIAHTETDLGAFATTDTYTGTPGQDVSVWRTFTFFVENTSAEANSAVFKLQISPDNTKWVDDSAEVTLDQGAFNIASTSHYLRYARVAYKSQAPGQSANLNITFQAQA